MQHLAALEKARAKCEARLKEELAAKGGIRSPLVQEGNQANPAPAKKAKAAAAARGGSKSRGKNGQARSSLEKQPGQQDVEMFREQGKVLEPSQKQLGLEKSGQKGDGLEKSTPQRAMSNLAWKSQVAQLQVERLWERQLQVMTLQMAWKSQLQALLAWKSQMSLLTGIIPLR